MKKQKKADLMERTIPNLYDYLKVLALFTMIIDHLGYYLFPEYLWLRLVGRIAFPIFLFLVGFNGSYRWKWNLFWRGIVLWVITISIAWKFWFWGFEANILIGILLARAVMYFLEQKKEIWLFMLVFGFLAISHFRMKEWLDYGVLPFFFVLWWWLTKNYKTWFFWWTPVMIRLFIQTIQVFDFWFQKGDLLWANILFVFYLILTGLFYVLNKENYILSRKNRSNQIILWISKYTLSLYSIHILILLFLGVWKFILD